MFLLFFFFFFFKQTTAYEIRLSVVGSEMCIRDRYLRGLRYWSPLWRRNRNKAWIVHIRPSRACKPLKHTLKTIKTNQKTLQQNNQKTIKRQSQHNQKTIKQSKDNQGQPQNLVTASRQVRNTRGPTKHSTNTHRGHAHTQVQTKRHQEQLCLRGLRYWSPLWRRNRNKAWIGPSHAFKPLKHTLKSIEKPINIHANKTINRQPKDHHNTIERQLTGTKRQSQIRKILSRDTHIHTHTHIHIHIHTYTYTYTDTQIHTYTHTHMTHI